MAELISIDLVLSALTATYDFCQEVRHAPGMIQKARKDAKKTKKQVELLRKRMKDPKSLLSRSGKEIKEMLSDDFEEIIKHAEQARDLAEEWKDINWWEFGSKSVYVARHKSKFEEMGEGLAECRRSIQHVMTTFVHTDGLDEILKRQDKLLAELAAMRSSRTKSAEKCQKVQRWAEQNSRKITDAAIHPDDKVKDQLVEQLVGVGMPREEAAARVGELLKTIRKERNRSKSFQFRVQAGLEEPIEKKKDDGAKGGKKGNDEKKKKQKENQPSKNQKKEGGKKPQDNKGDKETQKGSEIKKGEDEKQKNAEHENGGKTKQKPDVDTVKTPQAKKDQGKQNEKTEPAKKENQPHGKPKLAASEAGSSKESATKPAEKKNVHFLDGSQHKTENLWVLFVDRTNGSRSVMAHAYMELVRSWTMNTHKRWLFGRVNSCGLDIATPFNKSPANPAPSIKSPGLKAIEAMGGDEQHFWSKDPDEKDFILKRLRDRNSRGLHDTDFYKYQYILCFDERSRKELEAFKATAEAGSKSGKSPCKIQRLKGCEKFPNEWSDNLEQLVKVRGKIKVAVKAFLGADLGWVRPLEGIADGKWRTLQFLAPPKDISKAFANKDSLKDVAKVGCKVNVVSEFADRLWLVSISGPRAKLEAARKSLFGH